MRAAIAGGWLVTAAALSSIVLGVAARADDAAVSTTADVAMVRGADIYSHICQGCHMAQAQGAAGAGQFPRLAADPALASWQYVALTVLNGRKGMPGFRADPDAGMERFSVHLTDAQVAAVVNYVREHFGNHYRDHITADQVAALPHGSPGSEH
ncbi:MAG: cytochrome c [Pseudomonadota bacterium]|nr:cytochrome c [Pseudomonadota bacterium]